MQIAPLPIAKELWHASPIHLTEASVTTAVLQLGPKVQRQ